MARRLAALLAAAWAGLLIGVAALATPAPFALLPVAEAGRVVARVLAQEAWTSVAVASLLLGLLRADGPGGFPTATDRRLLLGTLAATGLGYFGVQALLPAARAGQGSFSFAQLHLFSTLCFGAKLVLVLAVAWRGTAGRA